MELNNDAYTRIDSLFDVLSLYIRLDIIDKDHMTDMANKIIDILDYFKERK